MAEIIPVALPRPALAPLAMATHKATESFMIEEGWKLFPPMPWLAGVRTRRIQPNTPNEWKRSDMRFISTRTHGIADYLIGILLVLAPFVLGFNRGGPETWVPLLVGITILVMSLFTRYEMGLVHAIPMGTHLMIDLFGGLLLLASPWLFGFAELVWIPHFVVGLLEIGAALTTRTQPDWAHQGM